MHVSRLALDRFRSWDQLVVDFQPGTNVLVGPNGLGKTNIVEALEVISTGSSHRTSTLAPVIERGCTSAVIRANREDEEITTYEATITGRGANRGRVNSGPSVMLRDIVGHIPTVSFTPEDQRLVLGDPAARRTFLNQTGAILLQDYFDMLQQFNHIAKQRATLLKQLGKQQDALSSQHDATLSGLEIWTGQFIEVGVELTRMRAQVVDMLTEPVTRIYQQLAGTDQRVELFYMPSFEEVLLYPDPHAHISEHFQRIYPGEVARGMNLIGPQRDDVECVLNGMPAHDYASNGETWTMALALKMALAEVVTQVITTKPIIILDDVFAQLDETRRQAILDFARSYDQVIITAAAASDVPEDLHANVIAVADLAGQQ